MTTKGRSRIIIAISGISGSGKTLIGSKLAELLGAVHLDQDSYYVKNKHKVSLSDGTITSNWDCFESLDLGKMNEDIQKHDYVIITGFALSDYAFDDTNIPNLHIHLNISKELSLQTRLSVKNFKNSDVDHQTRIFNELVYPFYQEIIRYSTIDRTVNCCYSGSDKRRPVGEILAEISGFIGDINLS